MFSNSVISDGLAGMQQSHKKMQQAAEQIVKAGMPTDGSVRAAGEAGSAPITNNGATVPDINANQSVPATTRSENTHSLVGNGNDVISSLVEIEKQKLIFNASAALVESENETTGRFIDDIS